MIRRQDVYTLSKLGDLMHALFSTHKESFLPVFDQLLPFVVKLLVSAQRRENFCPFLSPIVSESSDS
jgi:hypothetical protein